MGRAGVAPLRRISFATVAVTGLGAFVAVAVGVTLYVSASRGLRSTQSWMTQQAEARLDSLEQRITAHLRPIGDQADWIAGALADGRIDLDRPQELDAFMFGALGSTPHVSDLGIVDPLGRAWRWSRGARAATRADWSLVSSTTAMRHGEISDSDLMSASLTPQSPEMSSFWIAPR